MQTVKLFGTTQEYIYHTHTHTHKHTYVCIGLPVFADSHFAHDVQSSLSYFEKSSLPPSPTLKVKMKKLNHQIKCKHVFILFTRTTTIYRSLTWNFQGGYYTITTLSSLLAFDFISVESFLSREIAFRLLRQHQLFRLMKECHSYDELTIVIELEFVGIPFELWKQ